MTDRPTPSIEEKVLLATATPGPRPEFADQLWGQIAGQERPTSRPRFIWPVFFRRPAWAVALVILALAIAAVLIAGPDNVVAAFRSLLGYIPGMGIVEQNTPLRVLAQPASVTRDGVTLSVNQGLLTPNLTRLDYGVSGVPLSAYRRGEAVTGCIEPEYLRLPDGTHIAPDAPVPASIDQATFVMPCIFNTLPETVPTDWELPLRFIPAPPTLTVLPVVEVSPSVAATGAPTASSQPALSPTVSVSLPGAGTLAPTSAPLALVSVEKVIETGDGYILLGAVHSQLPAGSWLQLTSAPTLHDASGKKVGYTFPNDVAPLDNTGAGRPGESFSVQFKGAGVTFPITISLSGVVITQVDSQAEARIAFEAGSNPQPGQAWELDQAVTLAGNTLRLVSITADSDGYSFTIDPGPNLSGASVQIEGHDPNGGGGGGGEPGNGHQLTNSLVFNTLPKGSLTVILSNPISTSEEQTWQTQWQPETARVFTPEPGAAYVCLNADSLANLPQLPAGMNGQAVLSELSPAPKMIQAALDGSSQQVLVEGSAEGALSADGTHLAYFTQAGLQVLDLGSRQTQSMPGIEGRDLSWSPDGSRLAYVTAGDIFGIMVVASPGGQPKQLSNLGYEYIAGWSPDGGRLYYAIPGTNGDFLLRSVDVESGKTTDLFALQNSSRKAPQPVVSPDGKWIAYRASDNTSLYLMGMDGSPARLLIDNPDQPIWGLAWDPHSRWLGVSLLDSHGEPGPTILLRPDTCQAYGLSDLAGEINSLSIP